MEESLRIIKGQLYPLGVHRVDGGISIVSDIKGKKNSGIILYVKKNRMKKEYKILFTPEYQVNGLYCIFLPDFPYDNFEYQFFADDETVADKNARLVKASSKFGDATIKHCDVVSLFVSETFDWEDDKMPETPYHDTIIYKIHMRGFTKHASSRVSAKGTFAGLKEKIAYLKELGITAVETMPIYEFDDVIYNPLLSQIEDNLLPYLDQEETTWKYKVNYWGYTDGYYFAPKKAYSSSNRPDLELKDLIKTFHKEGLEFLADFYFPPEIPQWFILEVCRYWVKEYHLDGFKLMGCNLPIMLLTTDPYLKHTKLIFESLNGITLEAVSEYKNVAVISAGFPYEMRKYLKGDEDMLRTVMERLRENPCDYAVLNEITSYQGFTLADLVSYERKHNELNGEENRDGSDYNFSWNCGIEGKTKKKAVLALREQQSKNALFLLLSAQGTPILLAGDEFGNTADGNNNPYCQDNAISWLNWKETSYGNALLEFTKKMIAFRKAHPILHMEEAFRQSDYLSVGYPDLSYHCEQAWYTGMQNYNRHFAVMYCGKFVSKDIMSERMTDRKSEVMTNRNTDIEADAKTRNKTEDAFIFAAYNTHWIDHEFALPTLSDDEEWKFALSTCPDTKVELQLEKENGRGNHMKLPPRSMAICIGIKKKNGKTPLMEKKDESVTASKDNLLS